MGKNHLFCEQNHPTQWAIWSPGPQGLTWSARPKGLDHMQIVSLNAKPNAARLNSFSLSWAQWVSYSGWWARATPLKNMSSSIGMMMQPNIWENKKCSKPPTSTAATKCLSIDNGWSSVFEPKKNCIHRNPYTKSPKWFQNSKVYRCSPHLHCDSCLLHRWISVFSNMLSNNRPWNFTITMGIAAAIRVDCLTLWEISHRNVRLNGMVHRAVNFNNMMIYHVLSIFGMAISGFGIYSLLFGESTWKIFGSVHTRKSGWYVTDSLVSPWSPSSEVMQVTMKWDIQAVFFRVPNWGGFFMALRGCLTV